MTTERLLMRQVREILRLKYEQRLPHRAIARACGVGSGDGVRVLPPGPPGRGDLAAAGRLGRRAARRPGSSSGSATWSACPGRCPDMAWLHQELKRPGVTLQRLWLEYLERHPDGYRYSQFCRHYERWVRTLAPTMRQVHRAGEKVFVDFSGKRPCSSTPPRASSSRSSCSSARSAPAVTCTPRPACPRTCRRGSVPTCGCWSTFRAARRSSSPITCAAASPRRAATSRSSTAPTSSSPSTTAPPSCPRGPATPRDKAVVEANVLVAQRWILAALRHQRFFSLAELNAAIWELLAVLNAPAA